MAEEGKQVRPVAQHSFGPGRYQMVRAAPVFEAVALHASLWQSRGVQELPAGYVAFAECMPTTQYMPHFLEHVFGKRISIGAASGFLEPLELSDQMSPAKLPQPLFVIAAISRMVIGGDHPFEALAQYGLEHFSPTACGYSEVDNQIRNKNPKVSAIPFALPAGLIDVEICRFWKRLPCLLRYRLQFRAYTVDAIAAIPGRPVRVLCEGFRGL